MTLFDLVLAVAILVIYIRFELLLWKVQRHRDDAFETGHDLGVLTSDFLSLQRKVEDQGIVEVISGKLSKATDDAMCWDIYADRDMILFAGASEIVASGLTTVMFGCDALILDRSGLAAKCRITRRAGAIDSKYPSEWGVVLVNEGRKPYQVRRGDRIAQVLFIPKFNIKVRAAGPNAVVETSDKVRTGGFGSTGQ